MMPIFAPFSSTVIYESCSIDGASGWETFWKITLPLIKPILEPILLS